MNYVICTLFTLSALLPPCSHLQGLLTDVCSSGLISFLLCSILLKENPPNLFVHSLADGRLGCLHFGVLLAKAAVNILVHVFWWMSLLITLAIHLRVESDSMFRF